MTTPNLLEDHWACRVPGCNYLTPNSWYVCRKCFAPRTAVPERRHSSECHRTRTPHPFLLAFTIGAAIYVIWFFIYNLTP